MPAGRWIWRCKPERPVGTVAVVVLDVDPEDLLEVAAADDQQPVQALGADRPHPALGVRVRLGCPHRCHDDLAPSERNTSLKLRENWLCCIWTAGGMLTLALPPGPQIANANSLNATATRRVTGSSTASS